MKVSLVKKGGKVLALLFLCLALSLTMSGLALAASPPGQISILRTARFIDSDHVNVQSQVRCSPDPEGDTGGSIDVALSQDTGSGDTGTVFFNGMCDNRFHLEAVTVFASTGSFHLGHASATATLFNDNDEEVASANRIVTVRT